MPTTGYTSVPADAVNAYLAAQTQVDALIEPLIDLFQPDTTGRPETLTSPTAEWVAFGERWWRAFCSGSWFMVGQDLRDRLEFHRDPTVSLADCTSEMEIILRKLQSLTTDERVTAGQGMFYARDAALARQDTTSAGTASPTRRTSRSRQKSRSQWSRNSRRLAAEEHAIQSDIEALQVGLPTMPRWEPSGPSDRHLAFGVDWVVYTQTAFARQLAGEEGEALARTISQPPLSADEALTGLCEVRNALEAMPRRRRIIAFAAMEFAWRNAAHPTAGTHL